jgi:cytochrome d ubiquinol oxidase subunit I
MLKPEEQRTSDRNAFYFRLGVPKLLSLMSFRSSNAYVPGINDLVEGNAERGIMATSEKMERGRVAIDELARYRAALDAGDSETIAEIKARFDPATSEGKEFLSEYFAYFGYGHLDEPRDVVPNVSILFYSFRVMVAAGIFFILLLGTVWYFNRRNRLEGKRWLLYIALWTIPLAYLASQCGWALAEVGRQPWAIQDMMPVGVAASKIGSGAVATTFFIFLVLFIALLAAEIGIMTRQIKTGPSPEKTEQ